MIDWLLPILGLVVLGTLALDVFRTVFHAQGRGGPINRRQNRVVWRLVRWAGTRGGRVRPGLLALGGPLLAVITIIGWSVLLLAGFWLIYLPHILAFRFTSGEPGSALLESFYYSGIVVATLGHGDVVATVGWLRVVTVLQALAGFASLTVAVSYVLAVYRELIAARALASAIDAHLDHAGVEEPAFTLRLAHVLEAHHNYPVLHYFRPARASRSLPVQIARLVRGAGSATVGGALRAMMHRYIEELHDLFVDDGSEPDRPPNNAADRLDQLLRMMAYEAAPVDQAPPLP